MAVNVKIVENDMGLLELVEINGMDITESVRGFVEWQSFGDDDYSFVTVRLELLANPFLFVNKLGKERNG